MTTHRLPVYVCEDYSGCYTAIPVDECGPWAWPFWVTPAGVGNSLREAMTQLKECVSWAFRTYPHSPAPDFREPVLMEFSVPIRPEYRTTEFVQERTKERIYPCSAEIALRVPCVHGTREHGPRIACLPLLDYRFHYYTRRELKTLVTATTQQILRGAAPRDLERLLPPRRALLEEIVVRARRGETRARPSGLAVLDQIADPLATRRLRRSGSGVYARESEIGELVSRLGGRHTNVLLVGQPGVGKSSVLVSAVRNIERQSRAGQEEPPTRHRFWGTSGGRIIAGMRWLGQWQERCESLVTELARIQGVLCLENLLESVTASGEPGQSVAAFLVPYIQNGELRVVAEATPSEVEACRRLLPGLIDLFRIQQIEPLAAERAIGVLERIAGSRAQSRQIEVAPGVPRLVRRLFSRFHPYEAFPGRAPAFLESVIEQAGRDRAKQVDPERVVRQFVHVSGIPEVLVRDDVRLTLTDIEDGFRREVIGQDRACQAAAGVVASFKAELNDPDRPIGVLLFCGPTGVGKTQLARTLARFCFGHGGQADRLIRLDMSEYAGYDALERLLGSPYGQPSALVKRVRQQPLTVLLLDEIEKAGSVVFNALLGLLDEGRLTDALGRQTHFTSTIIIMTSNLGATSGEALGFREADLPSYDRKVREFFSPEFFNRIDEVVVFDPLSETAIHAITRKELAEIGQREGLVKAGLRLKWHDDLVEHLAREGFDRRYGARPLQRALERLVVAPLSRFLLENPGLRDCEVVVDLGPERRVAIRRG